jgi:uncharacterized protein (DUF4415 family)
MSRLRFEWDEQKARVNASKHSVSFEEAQTVFLDERALLIDDPDHSGDYSQSAIATAVAAMSFESSQLARRPQRKPNFIHQGDFMRKEYDFSTARKNPYAAQLKKQITIRLDEESINYFKAVSEEVGIPYQSLINLYLRECAATQKKLNLSWE